MKSGRGGGGDFVRFLIMNVSEQTAAKIDAGSRKCTEIRCPLVTLNSRIFNFNCFFFFLP